MCHSGHSTESTFGLPSCWLWTTEAFMQHSFIFPFPPLCSPRQTLRKLLLTQHKSMFWQVGVQLHYFLSCEQHYHGQLQEGRATGKESGVVINPLATDCKAVGNSSLSSSICSSRVWSSSSLGAPSAQAAFAFFTNICKISILKLVVLLSVHMLKEHPQAVAGTDPAVADVTAEGEMPAANQPVEG